MKPLTWTLAILALTLAGGAFLYWIGGSEWGTPTPPVVAGNEVTADPPRQEAVGDAEVDRPTDPRHTIFVEVVGPEHAPVAAAKVTLVALAGPVSAQTDAEGLATFENVSRRVVRVEIEARGFLAKKATPLPLTDATPEVSWTFELEKDAEAASDEAAVTGAVVSGGKPVAGAMVVALRRDVPVMGPADVQRTDASGRFVIPNVYGDVEVPAIVKLVAFHREHGEGEIVLAPGDLVIELPAGGFVEGRVVTKNVPLPPTFTVRAVPAFAERHPVLNQLRRAVRMQLRADRKDRRANVLDLELRHLTQGKAMRFNTATPNGDDTGDALPAGQVAAGQVSAGQVAAGQVASEQGAFRIGPIPAQGNTLVAAAENFEPASVEVKVSSAAPLTGVTLTLNAPLVVTGRVTDGDTGKPLSGVRIIARLRSAREGSFGMATTDNDGNYRLLTKANARQTLSAQRRGYLPFDSGGVEGDHGDALVRDFALRKAGTGKDRAGGHQRDYVGIGAQLKKTEEGVLVQAIFAGGAAAEVLNEGDIIVAVEGEWIDDMPLSVAVESILGEAGTDVELEVRRKGKARGHTEKIILERRRIQAGGG